ncbi:NEDD4-binding protein 2 isoform X1 [Hemiscyllium ocellatum]|uniref:NEDD4-binding protein 2 isoform X1 n=1 Tax=Hemiscyllium ocellatum TaxID=170820 RepID=UPI0029676D7E|nr:NEDD4-binding protein 2 isoform X1 [Hemiscyllium ocellatum]
MPRKRRNAAASSPARPPELGPPPRTGSATSAPAAADRSQALIRGRALGSSSVGNEVNKEELLNRMTEMFSHLDPSVVYVVLSECDFKADDAMDSLLVLSDAAEGVASSSFTGFDRVAATLSDDQVNSKIKVVMNDHGSNSLVASTSTREPGLNLSEQFNSSPDNKLKNSQTETNDETVSEENTTYQQYQPFMNQYNSPISQFSRLYVSNELAEATQSNLNSTFNCMLNQQQMTDDALCLRHSPFALNSKECEETLGQCFGYEKNVLEKRPEVHLDYNQLLSEDVESSSSKKFSSDLGVAFSNSTNTSSADIWTNETESNNLSAGISMNIVPNKYGDSVLSGQKYDMHSNSTDQQIGLSLNSSVSAEGGGNCSGTSNNEIPWFIPNTHPSSAENYKLFEETQACKGTNQLKPKNNILSLKPLANTGSNLNNIQQNTACLPDWLGENKSGDNPPNLLNNGEANSYQYSSSVLFPHVPNMSPISWNPWAPEFKPMSLPKMFVTPVAMGPAKPKSHVVSPWRPAGTGPGSPHQPMRSGTINSHSKSRLNQYGIQQPQTCAYPFPQHINRKILGTTKMLILMRGPPGSGKSTLARMLVQQGPNGMIFSTDDYFCRNGRYQFDPGLIGKAHEWNQKRAKEAMEKGYSPVIIDNTNTQAWEMKSYITMAVKHNYNVVFREPDTWWKFKPWELERRNIHGVSKEKIKAIIDHYEHHVTVNTIIKSSEPKIPETEAVELCPTSAASGAMNGDLHHMTMATRPSASSVCQVLPDSLMPPFKSTEHLSTTEINTDNLEQCTRLPSDFPSESRKHGTEHETSNNATFSKLPHGENIQKDQTLESNGSNYNLASHAETEDEKRKTIRVETFESKFEGTENTERVESHKDNLALYDDLPTAFSTSIGQRIRRTKWQGANSTSSASENGGTPKLPVEDDPSGENNLTEKSQAVEQRHQIIEPEFLNFVGDWPVAEKLKPQDQRKKKTRKKSELKIRNKSDTFDSVIPSDSLKDAASSLVEQRNIEISPGTNSSEISADSSDNPNVLSSTVKNSTSEINSVNHEEHKTLGAFEQQNAEALSEKPTNRKSLQNGGVGKSCKLALTLPGNSPITEKPLEPVLLNTVQMENSILISDNSEQNSSTQTAPEDFALLWKIENQKVVSTEFKILTAAVDELKVTDFDATQESINPVKSVPYKLVHDKSTFVDENAFVNEEENLQILSNCFKSVPFEDLIDLYEKCDGDIEWATNLLLDSGVKLSNEDPVNQMSVADDKLVTSSNVQVTQKPQMEKIDFDDQSQSGKSNSVMNQLSYANETTTDINNQSSVIYTQQNKKHLLPYLGYEDLSPPSDITTESIVIAEELKNTNIISEARDIDHDQFTNPCKEYCVGGECDDSKLRKDLPNDHVTCIEGNISHTSNIKVLNERSMYLSECIDVNDTATVSQPELNTFIENSNENQSSYNTEKLATEKETKETLEGESTSQDHLGLFSDALNIQTLELYLPPELAIQLTDLFGSVGLDPDYLTPEDCVVQLDLNLAKVIHQKWKETVLERKKQESLSYQLLLEDGNLPENFKWDFEDSVKEEEEGAFTLKCDTKRSKRKDGKKTIPVSTALTVKRDLMEGFPFMDHWNTQVPSVSLRDIMSEEMDFQTKHDQSIMRSHLSSKDCATKLKEKRLLEMFPGIDKHFIMDMYKDNNYSFEQTEHFLKSVFDCNAESTKTIAVLESVHQNEPTVGRNKKDMVNKDFKEMDNERTFQDAEFPNYEDFRAEAVLHRRKQQECFSKAAEAYRRGMKPVATFYAQQGHLHGEKMKQANHRAAVKILKQVNVSLLPQNVLDLHGLHVEEAQYHLEKVLFEKIDEYQQKGGKSYLTVITGRGSHSQGGVARIKPAVIDYLKTHNFRFTELQQGVVKIKLN